jgi:hypothetical protein
MKTATGLVCSGAILLAGCSSMGPSSVERDRFDYVTTISNSSKRQALLNLLKVRYGDAPVFMDVASVISSYSLQGEISLGSQFAQPGRGDQYGTVGATGRYADTPTITYQPLAGDRFAKSLMAPLPVTGILSLLQSGYPADVVLRVCVNSINGLQNAYGGPRNQREGSPKFHDLLTAMRESQAVGASGFRTKSTADAQVVVLFMSPETDNAAEHSRKIRELLGLKSAQREFTVIYGSFPENDAEIAILTRSILQVMIDLASYVDVPAADIAEGRVYGLRRSAQQERLFPSLITVQHGSSPPGDAYVAVQYRNHWFWVDDRDQQSKHMLSFLMLMFSLTEGGQSGAGPIVTVPAR